MLILYLCSGVSMGDNYYTNLLRSDEQFLDGTWDDSQHVTPIGTQPSPIVESFIPVRTNTKRTTSYKECEDNLLVSSWLNTSLDTAIGAEQRVLLIGKGFICRTMQTRHSCRIII